MKLAGLDVRQRRRHRLRRHLRVVAEDRGDGRAAAARRQMRQLQRATGLFEISERQMARAVEPARAEHQLAGIGLGEVDELLQRLERLLIVDQQQHRIGDQARQRNEIGAAGLGWPAEQLVDLGVSGNAGVVRQQGVAVGLGGSGDLRADLSGGAGLCLDHHRLLEDRLEHRRERSRHQIVDASGRKRIDNGDRVRGKRLLRQHRPGGKCGGGADDETAAIQAVHALLLARMFFSCAIIRARMGCRQDTQGVVGCTCCRGRRLTQLGARRRCVALSSR